MKNVERNPKPRTSRPAKLVRCGRWLGEAEARREIKSGMVIAAIKIIRERNRLPLREAMDIVYAWKADPNNLLAS